MPSDPLPSTEEAAEAICRAPPKGFDACWSRQAFADLPGHPLFLDELRAIVAVEVRELQAIFRGYCCSRLNSNLNS